MNDCFKEIINIFDSSNNSNNTFVEENIPEKPIYIQQSQSQDEYVAPISEKLEKDLRFLAKQEYLRRRKDGTPKEKVREYLKQLEPFNMYEYIFNCNMCSKLSLLYFLYVIRIYFYVITYTIYR